jgi:chitinase
MHFFSFISALAFFISYSLALDLNLKSNVAVYWGQNSAGQLQAPQDKWQSPLSTYCSDASIDIINLAFLTVIKNSTDGMELNFANQCNDVKQLNCSEIGEGIQTCQGKGKTVLLSIGGQITTSEVDFTSTLDAQERAEQLWQMFGPNTNNSVSRPFGNGIVDGFDLDLEHTVNYVEDFVSKLRELSKAATGKKFYLSASPMCQSSPNPAMFTDGTFDMFFFQFYNNDCAIGANFEFAPWNEWAKGNETHFFVGLPANKGAATGGYIPPEYLQGNLTKAQGSERMSGVMLWDISQAYWNDNYQKEVKSKLITGASATAAGTATAVAIVTTVH